MGGGQLYFGFDHMNSITVCFIFQYDFLFAYLHNNDNPYTLFGKELFLYFLTTV
mgnify:CR=1 FL=1